jgi:hypothetical protein
MSEVTRILSAIDHGDPHAAEQLPPSVYEERVFAREHAAALGRPNILSRKRPRT